MSLVAVVRRKGDQAGVIPTTRVVPVSLPLDVAMDAYFNTHSYTPILACPSVEELLGESPAAMFFRTHIAAPQSVPSLPDNAIFAVRDSDDEVEMCAASAPSDEDFLVELAGRLLSDGGMSGKDAEERLLASALALLAFAEMAQSAGTTAFDNHIRRLTGYLQSQDHSTLSYDRKTILEKALDMAAKGTVPAGAIALARQHLAKPDNAWTALRDLLNKA